VGEQEWGAVEGVGEPVAEGLRDGIGEADDQAEESADRVALEGRLQLAAEAEDLVRVLDGETAFGGEGHGSAGPVEEGVAHGALELPELGADGGLVTWSRSAAAVTPPSRATIQK
jgi:hypothetical protein